MLGELDDPRRLCGVEPFGATATSPVDHLDRPILDPIAAIQTEDSAALVDLDLHTRMIRLVRYEPAGPPGSQRLGCLSSALRFGREPAVLDVQTRRRQAAERVRRPDQAA